MEYKEFCKSQYSLLYEDKLNSLKITDEEQKEREAQKFAIREATVAALKTYQSVEASDIWKAVYSAHLHRKSGVELSDEVINHVVSADNSWKKSSGHAFEEIVKNLANETLEGTNIKVYLQRELSVLIKKGQIANEVRDISWLKEQLKASTFDLFITVLKDNKIYVFGCLQTKTSIRDRVTRDREPSVVAMEAFFWSIALVLDGDFLRLPKFIEMVNGGGSSYNHNGWHGLYVFSDKYSNNRIYPINIHLDLFKDHAIKACQIWLTQRQWMDQKWIANN